MKRQAVGRALVDFSAKHPPEPSEVNSVENAPKKRGKEGEGEILRRFHTVAEPSGGCLEDLGKPCGQPPGASRPLALRDPWRFATAVASVKASQALTPLLRGILLHPDSHRAPVEEAL